MEPNQLLSILLFVSATGGLFLAWYSSRYRYMRGAIHFTILMLAVSWWSLMDGALPYVQEIQSKLFLAQASYLGISIAPIAWFFFVHQYAGVKWIRRRWLTASLYSIGIIMFGLAMTNPWHQSLYAGYEYTDGHFGLSFEYGPLFWFWVATSYLALLTSTGQLIYTALTSSDLYRSQIAWLIFGAMLPWTGNLLYLSGFNPFPGFDTTPLAFVGVGLISTTILFRFKLFESLPVGYTQMFQHLGDAVFLLSEDLKILDTNDSGVRLLGTEHWQYRRFQDFTSHMSEEDNQSLEHYFGDILRGYVNGSPPEILSVIQGKSRWYSVSGSLIQTRRTEPSMLLISLRNITELRVHQKELEVQAVHLAWINRSAKSVISNRSWRRSAAGIIKEARELLQIRYSFIWDVKDENLEISTLPSIQESTEILAELHSGEWSDSLFKQMRDEPGNSPIKGEVNQTAFCACPLSDGSKVIAYWVNIWTKDAQYIEENMESTLLVSEILNGAIHRESLFNEAVSAQRKAEDANKAKSDFLSMMSHEIRTPLNAIVGLTHLLETHSTQEDLERLTTLKYASGHLQRLVQDVLDFNKIEAGIIALHPETKAIDDIIQPVIHSMAPMAEEKGIELLFKPSAESIHVHTDATRVSQVIGNLIQNAIKFTEKGKVKVLCIPHGLSKLRITVSDTGIGIPTSKHEEIFKAFDQVSKGDTRLYSGIGLGLSICQRLLTAMGSNLELTSKEGEGSSFWFDLDTTDITAKPKEVAVPKLDQNLTGIRVLLVEDNDVNRTIARTFLKKWEAEVDEAENGAIAVEMTSQKEYDIVLMDLQMPVMDGFEATLNIRKEHPKLPIIALTASARIESVNDAIQSGMNDVLSKPFNPDQFKTMMLRYSQKSNNPTA